MAVQIVRLLSFIVGRMYEDSVPDSSLYRPRPLTGVQRSSLLGYLAFLQLSGTAHQLVVTMLRILSILASILCRYYLVYLWRRAFGSVWMGSSQ
jgi:hypothetical protein